MYEKIDLSIVAFNSEKWISVFMNSLLEQSYPLNCINLFFSDNGSCDHTVELIKNYKSSHGLSFASFNIFERANDGFGCGHNFNVFNGNAKYVLVTNLDLEFEKDSIANVVMYAQCDKEKVGSWEMRQKPYEHPKDYDPVTLETKWSSSACVLFSRKAFECVSGYDNNIFMYGEDVDISFRLRDAGYKLKYVPQATCWHYAYEHANQLKELQFYGSVDINIGLRIRFGTLKDVFKGILMYFGLFLVPMPFKNHRRKLAQHAKCIVKNVGYFAKTRKKSNQKFDFLLWDYSERREGAFYEFIKPEGESTYDSKVSVIIRTFSGRNELLKQALKSVINQTYKNIEIVVVEDGTEENRKLIEEYAWLHSNRDFKYVSIPKSGRCIAGNVGLQNTSGQYINFLDDDDLLYLDHVEVLIGELKNNLSIDAVYSSSFEVPSDIISLNPLQIEIGEKAVIYKQPFERTLLWSRNYIPIQSILFKRELFEQYGGFDQELENLEDWNLWTRYSLNHEFKFLDKTTSLYRVPLKRLKVSNRQSSLNDYYMLAKIKQQEMSVKIRLKEIDQIVAFEIKHRSLKARVIRKIALIMKKTPITAGLFSLLRKIYFKVNSRKTRS